jgi:SAM-dependent methyltransferase
VAPGGYTLAGVPQHSCLLMASRDEATGFPRGDIELWGCSACGFVFNARFDPATQRFSALYEETQAFSPRFTRFAESLAAQLVERYGIRGRRVLEIGCGKGDFLATLCRLGPNRGVGIDPAYVPERQPAASADVTFLRERYSAAHASIEADFICCRHTLEHIANPLDFMQSIRAAVDHRPDVRVFIEVPDATRILAEGAFWDVYYEHCAYFTPASLVRLMGAAGFIVEDLDLAFDDQYLLLTARPDEGAPAAPATPAALPGPARGAPSPASVAALLDSFPRVAAGQIDHWRRWLAAVRSSSAMRPASAGRPASAVQPAATARVALWGSGSKGVAFLTTLGLDREIACVVDVNPHRQGRFMPGTGHPIVAPSHLIDNPPTHVVAMNPAYREEIRASLRDLGVVAEVLAVGLPADAAEQDAIGRVGGEAGGEPVGAW